MKVSRKQVAEHRQKILEAASRLFRDRGYDNVSVAEIMGAAGLTHGGFYGHFDSKDDLIAHTLAHLTPPVALPPSDTSPTRKAPADKPPRGKAQSAGNTPADKPADITLADYRTRYLSPRHRDDRANGCPVAALGGETVRQSPAARAVMTAGLRRQIDRFTATAPGATAEARRQAATANWAAMVGAVVLSRLSDDPALADQVLRDTQAWLESNDALATHRKRTS